MTAPITRQELLEIIEKAARTGQTELNLFTELPHVIGQLSSLQRLYLNGNTLTRLPDVISQLFNLDLM